MVNVWMYALKISDQKVEVKACHVSHSAGCYSYKFTQTKIKNKINIKKGRTQLNSIHLK